MHRRTLHELELLLLKLLFVTSLKHTAFGLNIKPEYWNIVLFVATLITFLHVQMLHLELALENTQIATIEEVHTAGVGHAA